MLSARLYSRSSSLQEASHLKSGRQAREKAGSISTRIDKPSTREQGTRRLSIARNTDDREITVAEGTYGPRLRLDSPTACQ